MKKSKIVTVHNHLLFRRPVSAWGQACLKIGGCLGRASCFKTTVFALLCVISSVLLYSCMSLKAYGADVKTEESAENFDNTQDIKSFDMPGGIVLGLYDWNSDLLVYYLENNRHKLCLVDAQSGMMIKCMENGYPWNLSITLCDCALPESESSPGTKRPNVLIPEGKEAKEIFIEDGIFCETEESVGGGKDGNAHLLRVFIGAKNTFQWLNKDFEVVFEYTPDLDISGQPLLDCRNECLYYVNLAGEVICQNLKSGEETRLEAGGPFYSPPYLEGIYNNGKIVAVSGNFMEKAGDGVSENIRFCKNYIDTGENRRIGTTESFGTLIGEGDAFFASMPGGLNQAVFGNFLNVEQKWEFIFDHYEEYDKLFAWPEDDRLLTFYTKYGVDGSTREICSLYSFESGHKVACGEIILDHINHTNGGGTVRPDYACMIASENTVAFHLNRKPGKIFVWNVQKNASADPKKSFKVPYLLPESQDTSVMEALKDQAGALGKRYGVEIYLGGDCPKQLLGYETEPALSAAKCRRALIFLEQALEKYPEGFFEQLAESNGGILKFYLVRRLIPDGDDSLSSTVGLYGAGSGQYIALSIDSLKELNTLVFHEISHAIDYKVSGAVNQNYEHPAWTMLNPNGFVYAGSYRANALDTSWEYVFNGIGNNENAYFIDSYSKSFPTEDRARIMEKAMGLYPETAFFTAPHIVRKLSYISQTIRENFDTKGWPPIVWWERPLI